MKWKVTLELECDDCSVIDAALNPLKEKGLIELKVVNVEIV